MENPPIVPIQPAQKPPVARVSVFLIIFFLGVIVGLLIARFQEIPVIPPGVPIQGTRPSSYEECIVYPGSVVQESYPSVCVTKEGIRFKQILSDETQVILPPDSSPPDSSPPDTTQPGASDYSCPANGYVNCMPTVGEAGRQDCSSEAMAWYEKNCPDFQGGAY